MQPRLSPGPLSLLLALVLVGCAAENPGFLLQGDRLMRGFDYNPWRLVLVWGFGVVALLSLISAPILGRQTGDNGPVLGGLLLSVLCGFLSWNEQRSWWTIIDAGRGELVVERSMRGNRSSTERWPLSKVQQVKFEVVRSKSRKKLGYQVELILERKETVSMGLMPMSQAQGEQGAWLQRVFGARVQRKD